MMLARSAARLITAAVGLLILCSVLERKNSVESPSLRGSARIGFIDWNESAAVEESVPIVFDGLEIPRALILVPRPTTIKDTIVQSDDSSKTIILEVLHYVALFWYCIFVLLHEYTLCDENQMRRPRE